MEVNIWLVIGATVAQFVLGALWYSPLLFGKFWMKVVGADQCTKEEIKAVQKDMAPFYGLQFLITVLYTCMLSIFILGGLSFSPYMIALLVWSGFIVPTQISGVIWGSTKKEFWVKQIGVMISYQLVGIVLATFILSL